MFNDKHYADAVLAQAERRRAERDEWKVGNMAIHGHKIYNQQGREVVSNIYRKEDAEQIVTEHNAVAFAVECGMNWNLEDWRNWLRFHARGIE